MPNLPGGIIKVSSDLNLVAQRHTGRALFLFPFYLCASVTVLFFNRACALGSPAPFSRSISTLRLILTVIFTCCGVSECVCHSKSPHPITWPTLRPDGLKARVYTATWNDTRGFFLWIAAPQRHVICRRAHYWVRWPSKAVDWTISSRPDSVLRIWLGDSGQLRPVPDSGEQMYWFFYSWIHLVLNHN